MAGLSKKLEEHGFALTKSAHMLHFFNGLFENYYLINLMQIFTKPDPSNQRKSDNKLMVKWLVEKEPPALLRAIRDTIMSIDSCLFAKSKKSLGILLRATKVS